MYFVFLCICYLFPYFLNRTNVSLPYLFRWSGNPDHLSLAISRQKRPDISYVTWHEDQCDFCQYLLQNATTSVSLFLLTPFREEQQQQSNESVASPQNQQSYNTYIIAFQVIMIVQLNTTYNIAQNFRVLFRLYLKDSLGHPSGEWQVVEGGRDKCII